jgi:hypothetical protein
MATTPQTYSNHTRWHAPFHFFVAPVMLINFLWTVLRFSRTLDWEEGWQVIVALALVVLTLLVRINPLRAQDRVIRLEERLRMREVLPAELARRAGALRTGQLVALRFAPDEELEGLVRQVLEGRLEKSSDIKRAIKNWRGDLLRV